MAGQKDMKMTSTGAIAASTQVSTSGVAGYCFGYGYSETGGSNGVGIELRDGGATGTVLWATSISAKVFPSAPVVSERSLCQENGKRHTEGLYPLQVGAGNGTRCKNERPG
jgi:hypothetical protein